MFLKDIYKFKSFFSISVYSNVCESSFYSLESVDFGITSGQSKYLIRGSVPVSSLRVHRFTKHFRWFAGLSDLGVIVLGSLLVDTILKTTRPVEDFLLENCRFENCLVRGNSSSVQSSLV
ncbi:hypothetical protein HHI36_007987 [Cryptolaemus montrouzieri]|uniref:Uncharacterized protein n=1 Tax=Cryptolaemus montrouzieri TaxID=559131 RepID=A0ABD2MR77_9CUCU